MSTIRAILVLGAGLVLASGCGNSQQKPLERPKSDMSPGSEKWLSADEAVAHVGQTVTVEYTVAAVGLNRSVTFLNSKPYRRGSTDFVAIFFSKDKPKFEEAFGQDLKTAFEGKRVRVTGEVKLYKKKDKDDKDDDGDKDDKDSKGTPEIILTSPDQIKIVQ